VHHYGITWRKLTHRGRIRQQQQQQLPYPLLKTLQVRYRIFSRKPLEYGTVSVALYTTDTEPYPGFKVL